MKRFIKIAVLALVLGVSTTIILPTNSSASPQVGYDETKTVGHASGASTESLPVETGVHAEEKEDGDHQGAIHFGIIFAMFALVLVAGKLGNIVEKFGQPAVIGELFAGIILAATGYFGWGFIDETVNSQIIAFLASFGALLLLFSIGLESNIHEMKKVGVNALLVAIIGVILPFTIGSYLLGPIFYESSSNTARLFLGAALVATSVGITASVFRTLGIIRTRAAQTVLGAAVIDDVLGLIVLAIVSAIAVGGDVAASSIIVIAIKAFGFLGASLLLGSYFAKGIGKILGKIHPGIGMKLALAVSLALMFGYLAEIFGLEPIIGAFAAGLFLEEVHFKHFENPAVVEDLKKLDFKAKKDREAVLRVMNKHRDSHVEDLITNLGYIFIPVFFVYTGMQIDFASLLQPNLYVIAAIISIFAIIGKMIAGAAAKGGFKERLLVGVSMVPRGEVGLIFAATGRSLGVLDDELFSVIVLVVIITTFIAPPIIKKIAQNIHSDKIVATS